VFRGKKIYRTNGPSFLWTYDSLILWAESPGEKKKKKSFALELAVEYWMKLPLESFSECGYP